MPVNGGYTWRGLLGWAFLFFCLTAPAWFAAMPANAPVSVTLETPDKPLKEGAELRLRATLKNISDRDLEFPTAPGLVPPDAGWYEIKVLDAEARPAPPAPWIVARRKSKRPSFSWSGSAIGRTLKPGQSLPEEIDVTRYYDLSRPGTYTIWVVRPLPVGVPPWAAKKYWKGSVRSNTITVTVVK